MKKEHLVLDSIHGLYYTIYLDTKLRTRYKIYHLTILTLCTKYTIGTLFDKRTLHFLTPCKCKYRPLLSLRSSNSITLEDPAINSSKTPADRSFSNWQL